MSMITCTTAFYIYYLYKYYVKGGSMRYITKRSVIVSLCLICFAITAICVRVDSQNVATDEQIIGGILVPQTEVENISINDTGLSRQAISIISKRKSNLNEIYFRPSQIKALNTEFMDLDSLTQTFKDGIVPTKLLDTPQNSLINYFSVLQQASNMTDNKTGGCGTVGFGKIPYPIAYDFLSENNKKSMTYLEYINSFEGIGHINLIKVIPIITDNPKMFKFFIELEILEGSSTGGTTFNYYTGEIDIINSNNLFYIDSLTLSPEDFLCAAYHGWAHDAESYVETVYGNWCGLIMKQYSPHQDTFLKEIIMDGVDKEKYLFKFAKLTNGTDLLINTLIRKNDTWIPVVIDVDKYLEKN